MRPLHLLLIAIAVLSHTSSSAVVVVAESAPTDVPCVQECGTQTAEFTRRCVDAGIDPLTCEAQARGALDACLAACDATAAPTCADQCELKARFRYEGALARHRSGARAARRARLVRRRASGRARPAMDHRRRRQQPLNWRREAPAQHGHDEHENRRGFRVVSRA